MFRFISAVLFALLLAGCDDPPEFVTPLSDIGEFQYDPNLLGLWYDAEGGSVGEGTSIVLVDDEAKWTMGEVFGEPDYVFSDEYPQSILQIALVFHNEVTTQTDHYVGFPTVLDGQTYFNLVRVDEQEPVVIGKDKSIHIQKVSRIAELGDHEHGYVIAKVIPLDADVLAICVAYLPVDETPEDGGWIIPAGLKPVRPPRFPPGDVYAEEGPGRAGTMADDLFDLRLLLEGDRSSVRRMLKDWGRELFKPVLVLTRFGTEWRDPAKDPALRAQIVAQNDQCRLDKLLPSEPGP